MMDEFTDKNTASGSKSPVREGEEIIQLGDIIKHQDELMEEVAAVLGARDDFNCSYHQGYMKRQALYACLTCVPEGKDDHSKAAGLCLACSYHCHDGHNLIELYTKRNFRCDCGNKKFVNSKCNLDSNKEDFNNENKYNQNFSGFYCTCKKPYPDPDDPIEDDMIQCIICEDWYHSRHLNAASGENYDEMICEQCVKANDFLMLYEGLALTKIEMAKVDETVNITTNEAAAAEENVEEKVENKKQEVSSNGDISSSNTEEIPVKSPNDEVPATVSEANEVITDSSKPDDTVSNAIACTKPIIKEPLAPKTLFMKEITWRTKLCKCDNCLSIYKTNQVEFLLDTEDTVEVYETKGREKFKDAKQKAVEAEQEILKSLPRAPLLDAMSHFNDFKEQLSEYLKQFADQQKVLTVDDVNKFFSKLNSTKRQKTSENTYFCR